MANFRVSDISYVMEVVNYVLEGHNIISTVNHFDVSKDVIIEALDMVRIQENPYYNANLGAQIETTLQELTSQARKAAGSKSHRPKALNEEDIISAIYYIIFHGFNTRTLGEKYGCSPMTISNAIKKLNCPEIKNIIGEARKLYSKYKSNPLYSRIIFHWLFGYQALYEVSDPKAFAILKALYNQVRCEFDYQREDYEATWTR